VKIFLSYTSSDKDWAHWIAWNLRDAGHEPFVHEWEVGAGTNIAGWMEQRINEAERLIGVFSDAYVQAAYSQSERWASYWEDPAGRKGYFVPIEVRKVTKWPALVSSLKRLSVVGLDEAEARTRLVDFLQPPSWPIEQPVFPGSTAAPAERSEPFSEGSQSLGAQPPAFPTPRPPSPMPRDGRWRWLTAGLAVAVVLAFVGAAVWWFYDIRKGDYTVMVQSAGIARDDMKVLMRALRRSGWNVQGVEGGGQEIADAQGRNEVRYIDDERAARMLAKEITAEDFAAETVVARRNPKVRAKTLEAYISRPNLIPTLPTPSPGSPRIDVDPDAWNARVPDQGYCFQRKDSPVAPGKFLVRCFAKDSDCRRIQATDSGQRTSCMAISGVLSSAQWRDAGRGGVLNSWYKYADREFQAPFPQFSAR
jgi:hypothetical protein